MSATREATYEAAVSGEALAFARERGLEDVLPVVMEAAGRLVPGTTSAGCVLELDDEAETWHLVVILRGDPDAGQTLSAYQRWHQALFDLVGASRVCLFRFELERPA